MINKMKKESKKKINYLILVLVTIIVLYFSLKDNFNEITHTILTINIWYLLIAFVFIFLFWLFRSYPMYTFSKKINKDFKYKDAFILTLRTQFFNAVTPFATGGQPYQIYYLKNKGIDYASSTSIVLENFIVYQIALVLLGLIALFTNKALHLFKNVYILQRLIALGFIINTLVIVAMFIIAFSKKMNKKIIGFALKLLNKLHIVKDIEKKEKEWNESINKFHESASILLRDKKSFILNIFSNFLALSLLYLIPLIVLYSMGDFTSVNPLKSIVTSAYVMLIGSFVPIPGATGGLEYGFVSFYGNFISGSTLQALMLVWRFITYYFGMIMGAIVLNIHEVKK